MEELLWHYFLLNEGFLWIEFSNEVGGYNFARTVNKFRVCFNVTEQGLHCFAKTLKYMIRMSSPGKTMKFCNYRQILHKMQRILEKVNDPILSSTWQINLAILVLNGLRTLSPPDLSLQYSEHSFEFFWQITSNQCTNILIPMCPAWFLQKVTHTKCTHKCSLVSLGNPEITPWR